MVAVSRPVLQAVVRHVGLAKRLLGWHWDRGPCLEGWKEVAGLEEVDLNQANVHANHIHSVLGGDLSVKKGSLGEVGGGRVFWRQWPSWWSLTSPTLTSP